MTDHAEEDRESSDRIGVLRALLPFLRPYRIQVIFALLALIITASVSLIMPLAAGAFVDSFQNGATEMVDRYARPAMWGVGILALGTASRYYLVTRLGERVVADIRKAVFARMISMSPGFFDYIMTGEVVSRITTDTTLILAVISSSISIALRNTLIFFGGFVMMFWTSPKLTLIVMATIPTVILPIVFLGMRMRNLSRENQGSIADSSGNASEALLSVQTVQAFTHEKLSRDKFDAVTERSFVLAKRRIATRSLMMGMVIFMIFSAFIGVVYIGARGVSVGGAPPGDLVQFVIYALMVASAVGALSEIWGELQRAAGATERLVELLHAKDSVRDPEQPLLAPEKRRGELELRNVSFRYPSRPESRALKEVNLHIKQGETVALVGPSGAGKSTTLQQLLRFYDPDEGEVLFDGVDLRELSRGDFRRHMALVPQDPVIFADTARENIRFGRPDATDAEVEDAARAAAAFDFISELPQGFETYVGERGVMLSGGQKQRVAIARAILRDAPVLLLDEATSALDAHSERLVQTAVEELTRDRTTVVIAHRLATVKKADRIVVMDKGRILAQGTHDSLVAEGGLYAELAKLQFTDIPA